MKRYIAYTISWLCYTLAHAISYPMDRLPWKLVRWMFHMYSALLRWSRKVESWAGVDYKWLGSLR